MSKIKDWVNQWIEKFGTQKDDDDVMLVIEDVDDSNHSIYEGHFLDVPEEMYDFEIVEKSRIAESTDKRRNNAYVFGVSRKNFVDTEKERSDYICNAVAERIRSLCKKKGCTINHLSTISNVTQSTVSDIVNGKSKNVGIITLYKLCVGLGINLEDFFSDELFRW